jgi:hypothetical protein
MATNPGAALAERWEVYQMAIRLWFWDATRVVSSDYSLRGLLEAQLSLAQGAKFAKSFLQDADALEAPAYIREEMQRILDAAPAARARVKVYLNRRRLGKAPRVLKPSKELLRLRKRVANLRQKHPRPTCTQASWIFEAEQDVAGVEEQLWKEAMEEEFRADQMKRRF